MPNIIGGFIVNKLVATKNAPKAIGPYAQAIDTGDTLYVSGQLPISAETGLMVTDNITTQTNQCLVNIENIILASNYQKTDIVKCSVYLSDFDNFAAMNKVYEQFFGNHKPARVTVEVSRLPKDSLIEIDAICHK